MRVGLIRKAGQVIRINVDSLESVLKDRMLAKLLHIRLSAHPRTTNNTAGHFQLQTGPAEVQQSVVREVPSYLLVHLIHFVLAVQ